MLYKMDKRRDSCLSKEQELMALYTCERTSERDAQINRESNMHKKSAIPEDKQDTLRLMLRLSPAPCGYIRKCNTCCKDCESIVECFDRWMHSQVPYCPKNLFFFHCTYISELIKRMLKESVMHEKDRRDK